MRCARRFAAVCLGVVLLAFPLIAEAFEITIDIPSDLESVLESGRDFYVAGTIERGGATAAEMPVDIRVEVADAGLMRDDIRLPVRVVESRVSQESGVTEARDIFFEYPGKAPWVKLSRDEILVSPPPDIIFRDGSPESFLDPRVKAVVTENSYAVLVQGGATSLYDSDYSDIYDKKLAWNYFRVTVSAIHKGQVIAEVYKDVMLGSVPEKVLARFDPPNHFEKTATFAHERGFRLYRDPFPGCWNAGLPSPYEIPLRWRPNNALEFTTGFVHTIIYNISEECAEQSVALGRILYEGRMFRDDQIFFYTYDIGEPSLAYEGSGGEPLLREGKIVPFECEKRLRFTRAEIGERPQKYFPRENASRVDFNVYNSVALRPGEPVTFYGAVAPIQPMLSEIEPNDDGTYSAGNRITTLRLRAEEKSRGEVIINDIPIGLARFYDKERPEEASPSIYEFRHSLELPARCGKSLYTVTTRGFDAHGEPVDGTETIFYLWVRP